MWREQGNTVGPFSLFTNVRNVAKFLEEPVHAEFTRSTIPSMLFGSHESCAKGDQIGMYINNER